MENVIIFKIDLEDSLNEQTLTVQEYHKGRMEPYPKVIRVYEKQKVELYDSKYFLSVYHTVKSLNVYQMTVSDLHYKSQEPSDEHDNKVTYGPYKNIEPMTFDLI